ncbi:MAG: hypothetical protein ACK4MF_08340 [Hyphomicrobiaceae bacterium]
MADETMAGTEAGAEEEEFGSCCSELKEAMSGKEFEPLIQVGEDGILYMSVGLIDIEGEEPGMVDHPVFFCPFCGTELQARDELRQDDSVN